MWNEGKASELMNTCFEDSCVESQVLRYIHVGLLCTKKYSKDRPTMNSVILMLANEGVKLPQPKQPDFFIERSSSSVNEGSTLRNEESFSGNGVALTFDGR